MIKTMSLLCRTITQNTNGTSLVHLTSRLDDKDDSDGHTDLWFHVHTETCNYQAGRFYNAEMITSEVKPETPSEVKADEKVTAVDYEEDCDTKDINPSE